MSTDNFDFDSGNSGLSDLMSIEDDVKSLAGLMAHRNVLAPFSIGLLGEKGSGKSFFINKLSQQVDALVHQSTSRESMYCRGVVQVHYNAWHYAGTNPWIGLVEVIFTQLNYWWSKKQKSFSDPNQVFSSIGTAKKLYQDVVSNLERSKRLVESTRSQLADAREQNQRAMKDHAECLSRDKWIIIQDQLLGQISDFDRKELDEAGNVLGFKRLSENSEKFEKALDEAKTLGGRASLMTSSLRVKRHLGNLVMSLLGLLIIGFASFLIFKLSVNTQNIKDLVDILGKGLAGLSTVIGFLSIWIGIMTRNRASLAIDKLQKHEPLLRELIRSENQKSAYDVTLSEHKITTSQKAIDNYQDHLAKALSEYAIAEEAFQRFEKDGILNNLVKYYRAQMLTSEFGLRPDILPIIREDFIDLHEILIYSDDVKSHFEPSLEQNVQDRLDRFIVYIDDLDQCPPAVVSAVLQAVELLLSFPLFVVVIAGHPLWLINSIKSQYPDMAEKENINLDAMYGAEMSGSIKPKSSSLNDAFEYLSKLIQVPFWIKPLDSASVRSFVKHFTNYHLKISQIPIDILKPMAEEAHWAFNNSEPHEPDMPQLELLTDAEVDYLEKMSDFLMSSPRHVKRFINTYKLIRWRRTNVSIDSAIPEKIENDLLGYMAILTQLAILIAAPFAAPSYFRKLMAIDRPGIMLSDFLSTIKYDVVFSDSTDGKAIIKILEVYGENCHDENSALFSLVKWSSLVRRYSFMPPN